MITQIESSRDLEMPLTVSTANGGGLSPSIIVTGTVGSVFSLELTGTSTATILGGKGPGTTPVAFPKITQGPFTIPPGQVLTLGGDNSLDPGQLTATWTVVGQPSIKTTVTINIPVVTGVTSITNSRVGEMPLTVPTLNGGGKSPSIVVTGRPGAIYNMIVTGTTTSVGQGGLGPNTTPVAFPTINQGPFTIPSNGISINGGDDDLLPGEFHGRWRVVNTNLFTDVDINVRLCQFCWGIEKFTLENGEKQVISVFGGPPGKLLGFKISMPSGKTYTTGVTPDRFGKASTAVTILDGSGPYKVEPVCLTCDDCCEGVPALMEFIATAACPGSCAVVEVLTGEDLCDFADVVVSAQGGSGEIGENGEVSLGSCDQPVTVTPLFLSQDVPSGSQVTVKISVKNENVTPIEFSLAPLTLPSELSGTVFIPATIIKEGALLEKAFVLSVSSGLDVTAVLVVPSGSATYNCGGNQYSASGGQDGLAILGPAGAFGCDLRVQSFEFVPAVVEQNVATQLVLTLKNYGIAQVTKVNMAAVAMPAGFSGNAISISNETIGAGQTLQVTSTGTCSHTETSVKELTAHIPANHINYTCKETVKFIAEQSDAAVSVAAVKEVIPTGGGVDQCSGGLDWISTSDADHCGVQVRLIGGIAGATYNYSSTSAGGLQGPGSFVADVSGNGGPPEIIYAGYDAGSTITVTVAKAGCTWQPLVITLPICNLNAGGI